MRRAVRVGWICLVTVMFAVGPNARAQDEQGPGPGFGGGQMVRGTVTAATGDHLTIKTDKGDTFQVTVTTNTRLMKERQPAKAADIKPGDSIGAMGLLDAPTKTVHAMFVMVMDAEAARKAREGLGKAYIAGKVTAMDELKLTILRPDGVSQVIAVDESTSFKKGGRGMRSMMDGSGPMGSGSAPEGRAGRENGGGGESITLADIKVGDSVMGRGELKAGVFVPSELGVLDASARPRRRRPEAGGAAATPQEPQ